MAPPAVAAPIEVPVEAPVEAPAPAPTTLSDLQVAALPFRLTLPRGFRITTGRPGPDFNIYTVRRGDQSFVMIYTGAASDFPFYDGQLVEVTGRSSVVVDGVDGRKHAMEHLFQRQTSPHQIHIWVSSLDGVDAQVAEDIAQSVDAR